MVYTSPESLKYICECNRDATVNFDQEEPVARWARSGGRGRGAVRGNQGRGRGRGGASAGSRGGASVGSRGGASAGSRGGANAGSRGGVSAGVEWGGRGRRSGINIRQVLQDACAAMINEEERERVHNVLSVPLPKEGEIGTKTGYLPKITGHQGFYYWLCDTSFGDDDDMMVDDQWVYCPICFMMSHVSCLKLKPCMCGFKPKRHQLRD